MSARILVVDDSPTIRKVVAAILEASAYQPTLAEDGEQGLSRLDQESFDLVLLDFVMPRMNGYQFCRELRAREKLKGLPVVLMSAKGDRIREQFVQQTGAIDAITKPFDARGLIAVVEGALRRRQAGKAPPLPDPADMPEEELLDENRTSRTSVSTVSGVQARGELVTELGRTLGLELMRAKLLAPGSETQLREALERALTPDSIRLLGATARGIAGDGGREVLAGDVSVFSIAEVLQMLQLQRQTGSLEVTSHNQQITLYVGDGNIDYACSRGLPGEFLFGRYLIRERVVPKARLEKVLADHEGSDQLLGQRLVALGLASDEQIRKVLVTQTSELVYEVVRWTRGRFALRMGEVNRAAAGAQLGLGVGGLVMEGFRRVDEWRLIEGSFDFEEVLYRDPGAIERLNSESELTPHERSVLDAIDGERTVREIVDEVQGSSFELCKILYQFLNSRLVRRRAA